MTRQPIDPISAYVLVKDSNRPWLMKDAFTPDARLEMIVKTDAISFPASVIGRAAITELLVDDFSRNYQNIAIFCLGSPPSWGEQEFSCSWMVGMSNRADAKIYVGCGLYDWHFEDADPPLATMLTITIECMEVLASEMLDVVMSALSEQPYPWCDRSEAIRALQDIPALASLAGTIERDC